MIDEQRLYKELEKAGVSITVFLKKNGIQTKIQGSLLNIVTPPDVIPVYVDFLQNEEFDSIKTKEMVVRMLTVKEARGIANKTLISEYHKYQEKGLFASYRWAIGNAMEQIITGNDENDILSIVLDKNNGKSRQMFVCALKKLHSEKVENALIYLLDNEYINGQAIYALGMLKSKKAKTRIESFLLNSNAWHRKEAKKALKRIG
jgi:HEAT repeat protein